MTDRDTALRDEPLSAAAEAKLRRVVDRLLTKSGYLTVDEQMVARLLATLDRDRAVSTELAKEWEASAEVLGERVSYGDPAATLATITTLRNCAAALRAATDPSHPTEEPR